MKLKLFQIACLLHPKETYTDRDGEKFDGVTELIGEIKTYLCADEKHAAMLAAREIPEKHIKDLNRVEVIVRPF